MRAAIAIAGLALALVAPGAAACGYCVEDKIASTYDHAVVTRALAQKHQVAFFHLDGPVAPGADSSKALAALAEKTPGIDKGTVRVVADTLTISFAYDPRRSPLAAVQAAMEKRLAPKKLSLMPLRIIDSPAELKAIESYKVKLLKP